MRFTAEENNHTSGKNKMQLKPIATIRTINVGLLY